MRESYNNRELILDDDGNLIALCFGYDFACEHECGMGGFFKSFGIKGPTRKVQGVKSRTIQKFNEAEFLFKDYGDHVVFMWSGHLSYYKGPEREKHYEEIPRGLKPLTYSGAKEDNVRWSTAWTSGPGSPSFGLRFVKGDKKVLDQLREAFMNKDVAMWTAGGGFMGRGGLVLAIASRVPEEMNTKMVGIDLDHFKLQDASDKTKILKRLADAGKGPYKGYFACSPGWKLKSRVGGREIETKHPVMYFLNPYDQKNNNFGWFTVEELDQWIEGKGPIPGKKGR